MSLKQRAASGQQGAAPAVASFPQQQMPRVVEDRREVAGVCVGGGGVMVELQADGLKRQW